MRQQSPGELAASGLGQPPKVALVMEAPNSYTRALLVGIGEYILSHGPWRVYFAEHGSNEPPPAWLACWDGQGIIARGENRCIAACVAQLAIPTVDMTPSRLLPNAP